MKFIVALIASSLFSMAAFATSTIECKSANYGVVVADVEEFSFSNYSVNGEMNDGADVELEKALLTKNVIALSLKIEDQQKMIVVSATKNAKGTYTGSILFNKTFQTATCTRK